MPLNPHQASSNIDWPKISIVTPSFNQGQYIEQTIKSVLDQGYPNLEYVIIDGGSTDNTVQIIRKYEQHITYWISEPDRGQSHAINKGLEKCSGDIINWLNSDDWLMPNSLLNIAEAFINNPDALVVSGKEIHIYSDGESLHIEGTKLKPKLIETIETCQLAQPSTFFKANAFKLIAPVPEDIHYIMDGELWMRFLLQFGQNKFIKLQVPLVNFRLHKNSKTVNNGGENNYFLIERSSIIIDLQRFAGVPEKIIHFWEKQVFNTPKIRSLNRSWKLNNDIIGTKEIRVYFIKKYINYQFLRQNFKDAWWGINQLLIYRSFDIFLVKSFAKLILR